MENKSEKNRIDKPNKKVKTVISVIEYFIVFVVIFVNAFLIINSTKNPNKSPAIFGKKAFVIISGSMIPQINIGDIVLVNDTVDVHKGDIIAFRSKSSVIVHRIIQEMTVENNKMFQTKGDNNEVPDIDLVEISKVEGLMVGKIPYIGKIFMWLYNNLAIVVVIIIVVLLLKYYYTKEKE